TCRTFGSLRRRNRQLVICCRKRVSNARYGNNSHSDVDHPLIPMMRWAFYIPLASDRRTMRRLKTGFLMAHLFIIYIVLALLKHMVPLTWLVRRVWCPPVGPRDCEAEGRLTSIVLRLSRLTSLPDRDCLQRSLLLYRVLSHVGAEPT